MNAQELIQLKQTLIIKAIGVSTDSHPIWHFIRPTRLKLSCIVIFIALASVLYVVHTSTRVVTSDTTPGAIITSSATAVRNKDVYLRNLSGDAAMNRLHYEHLQRRFPQCVIIGVRKAGTRVLLSLLDMHPNIITKRAEVHYFDWEENYVRGDEWYRQQMPFTLPDQMTIEKTPAYFHTPEVPQRMRDLMSKVRLLVIVRDPVVRAISDWLQLDLKAVANDERLIPFERLAMRYNGSVNENYTVLQRSLYNIHLKRWLKYFSPRQIHIVDGDVFQNDPYQELALVEDFLRLPKYYSPDLFYFNETKGFSCRHMPDGEDKCFGESKGRKHPPIDPHVIRKLEKYFKKYNKRFYAMVERDFHLGQHDDDDEYSDDDSKEEEDRRKGKKKKVPTATLR